MPLADICTLCRDKREDNGEEPRLLVEIEQKTPRRGHRVLLCEHCDGPALELARKNAA